MKRTKSKAAPNGWKLSNQSEEENFPRFERMTEKNAEFETIESVSYQKYFDGTGAYVAQKTKFPINSFEGKVMESKTIKFSPTFKIKKLLKILKNM